MNSITLTAFVVMVVFEGAQAMGRLNEFQRYDGWYNNLANPNWGTAGTFVRFRRSPKAAVLFAR